MKKNEVTNQRYWVIFGTLIAVGGLLYVLRSVLLPFVVGMVVAYFLNPAVNRMTKVSRETRSVATVLVMGIFLLVLLPICALLGYAAISQLGNFISSLPQYLADFWSKMQNWITWLQEYFPWLAIEQSEDASHNLTETLKPLAKIFQGIVTNGFAFINVLSLLLISPVVAFYMLRDWPIFTKKLFDLVPKTHKKVVNEGVQEVNRIISGYLRGQMLVCLSLGTFYSLGLWLVDLHLGIMIGFIAGIISFIPYVGSISGFLMAIIMVVTQYGTAAKILEVIAVFALGQFLEGNFLTPKLVGENIGLHPVWVMFALLAGGSLLGLLGMIIAVPIAACIGVLLRFIIRHYKQSPIYLDK